jgi:DNA helicase-2/ATP-dependent DNA helicase PcrA
MNSKIDDEAWRREPGPTLLIAGPGTGKTHQLALRIKDRVENKNVSPDSITVITFTKDAAENMRRRIADEENPKVYICPEKRPPRITTMHSLGLEIIRANGEKLSLSDDFQVMTNSRLRRVLFHDAALLAGLGKNEAHDADEMRQKSITPKAGTPAAKIMERYEAILRASNAIDYDDEITLACKLLRKNSDVLAQYSAACVHLLIGEYQDINAGQRKLIGLLSKEHLDGLFVAGDDDQSIYSFRGGTPQYIRDFDREYGNEARILSLVKSRRCPDTVVRASLDVVRKFDPTREKKPDPVFAPEKQNAARVKVHDVASDDQEAQIVAGIIRPVYSKKRVLVLIPAKQYAEKIKRELRKKRIPYSHPAYLDDSGFALLQVVHNWRQNPDDNLSLRLCVESICNSGAVGIPSNRSRSAVKQASREHGLKEIANLWKDVIDNGLTLWKCLGEKSKTKDTLLAAICGRLEALLQVEPRNVDEFLSIVARSFRPWANLEVLMKEVEVWVEELQAHGHQEEGGVKIMTLQGAKGLEADIVCVIGLDDRILPRADAPPQQIEESARLTYVSMTRAKEQLHLFHARTRDASVTYLPQSYRLKRARFLDAIDKRNIELVYHQAPSRMAAHSS